LVDLGKTPSFDGDNRSGINSFPPGLSK